MQSYLLRPLLCNTENELNRSAATLFVKQQESAPVIIYGDTPAYTRSDFKAIK
jgi:hypothetical protein